MVVPREKLFAEREMIGFLPFQEYDFETKAIQNYEYQKRGPMESDASFKQPIGYAMVWNPKTQKIFVYKRAGEGADYGEKDLFNKYSRGVGGHIEKEDESSENPIRESMKRELEEEIGLTNITDIKPLGYINLEHDVHTYHFCILYLVETPEESIEVDLGENAHGSFMSMEEVKALMDNPDYDIEEWSRTAYDALHNYLNR